MKAIEKWKTLKTDIVIDNKWCKVNKDTVELPSGKIIDDYYLNIRPEVAVIFPLTHDNNVVMVRQYKHGAHAILMEFPGGVIDGQESPLIAAQRELREETGYSASRMEELGFVYDNPTKDTNKIFFFLAHDAEKTYDIAFDVTEDIETVEIPLTEIPHLIKTQKINVAGSIALYYIALTALNQGS